MCLALCYNPPMAVKGEPVILSDEQISEMVNAYLKGSNLSQIESQFGVPRAKVKRTLVAAGVEVKPRATRRPPLTAEQKAFALALFDEGLSLAEIERGYGFPRKYVAAHLDEVRPDRPKDAPRQTELTAEQRELVTRLYDEGWPIRRIWEENRFSRGLVEQHLSSTHPDWKSLTRGERSNKTRGRQVESLTARVILDAYQSGTTVAQAARLVGVHVGTAAKWLKKAGVEIDKDYRSRLGEEDWAKHCLAVRQGLDPSCDPDLTMFGAKLRRDRDAMLSFIESAGVTGVVELAKALQADENQLRIALHNLGLWDLFDHAGVSSYEAEIQGLLNAWGVAHVRGDRSLIAPKELDFLIPEHNLAIEVNGSYWHSELRVPASYHEDKTRLARDKGVLVFHIWQWEWDDPRTQPIIISQLRNLLGLAETRIFARKCEVRKVPLQERREFLNKSHIQGDCPTRVAYGLYHDNELVSIMTLGRPRHAAHKAKYIWEMLRFCSRKNTSVVGAGGKLFSAFLAENSPSSVLSFSANDKTTGNLYSTLGFTLESEGRSLSYVWTDLRGTVLNRGQTQMKNEDATMRDRGFVKVVQCSQRRWVWTPPLC